MGFMQDDGPIFNEWLLTHMPYLDALAVLEGSEEDHTTVIHTLSALLLRRSRLGLCWGAPRGLVTAVNPSLALYTLSPSSGRVKPALEDAVCSAQKRLMRPVRLRSTASGGADRREHWRLVGAKTKRAERGSGATVECEARTEALWLSPRGRAAEQTLGWAGCGGLGAG
jgi:hypothetical protein